MRYASLLLVVLLLPAAAAQNLADFEKDVTEFTLDNGLKFIVLERHDAPVVSCYTHVDVGAVDEVKGITGLAHIFEHMAFKGTSTIGTKDYQAEAKALERIDAAFKALKEELQKGKRSDPKRVEELRRQLAKEQQEAQQYSFMMNSRKR